jgi:hypothetical protein
VNEDETELDILSHHFDVIVDDEVVWTGKDIYEAFQMKKSLGGNAIVKVSAQVKLEIESDDEEG